MAATARDDARTAHARLDEAVDGLRAAGANRIMSPRGLLARAAFRRSVGDWDGAARDLDEVEEIAEPGPMRLFLCDMALERARLAFARSEAFAPLNGLIDDSPPKPERPSAAERKRLHDEAAKQLAIAADYIAKCGYHRRDEELAELQAVLARRAHLRRPAAPGVTAPPVNAASCPRRPLQRQTRVSACSGRHESALRIDTPAQRLCEGPSARRFLN